MKKILLLFLLACSVSMASARELKIFLLTGQSNSLGTVKGSPASPELLKKYEPQATLYWHENFGQREGVFAGASTAWEQVRPAMPRYNGNLCMGPEYGFAFTLEKNGWFKDADVAVVKASRDGGDNSHWQKHGQAYQALVQAVKNACGAVDRSRYSKVTFSGLLYLQGESNAGTSVPESASRFLELLNDLSADLKPYGDTSALAAQKAIIGENANWDGRNETDAETGNITGGLEGRDTTVQGKTTQQVMKSLAASRPGMGYVPTRDLPKLTAGDTMGVHYSGTAQISIGARFAYEAARLAGKDAGSVRSGRYDVPLGAPEAWMNRKQPGKNVCVWNVASSIKPSVVSGTVKLFGIRVEDPAVNTVVIEGAGASGDRLVLGPGGIRLTEGKNLLIKGNVQLAGRQTLEHSRWFRGNDNVAGTCGAGREGSAWAPVRTGGGACRPGEWRGAAECGQDRVQECAGFLSEVFLGVVRGNGDVFGRDGRTVTEFGTDYGPERRSPEFERNEIARRLRRQ